MKRSLKHLNSVYPTFYRLFFSAAGFYLAVMLTPPRVWAAELKPPTAAQVCVGCHGANGVSNNPLWPNLAGQKKQYLIKQIKDFKGKHRKDQLMSPMASTLNEKEIEAIAEYYSQLKCN